VYEEGELCNAISDKSKGVVSDKCKGDGVFIELETFEKRIGSNKQNTTSPTTTQTIPDERNLSLDNDLCKGYVGDTKAVNHDEEEAEMIELCAGDTYAVNPDEEETTKFNLPAPPTKEFFAQNILDNPITEDTSQPAPKHSQRPNKGVTKKQYESDIKTNVRYPINNYVSSHRLSEPYALTINQLSKLSIPSNVQDALAVPRWKKAMNEQMKALQKTSTWELVALPEGKKSNWV
jgi:hypothetical protein